MIVVAFIVAFALIQLLLIEEFKSKRLLRDLDDRIKRLEDRLDLMRQMDNE